MDKVGDELSFDIKIEDIEKILDKDFTAKGSAERAYEMLKKILAENKDE